MSNSAPYFLGAGLATCLGNNVSRCTDALREVAKAPSLMECHVFDHVETIPYKLLDGVALTNLDQRIYNVIDGIVQEALDEAQLTQEQQQKMALFVGSSSFDISVSECLYQRELKDSTTALPLRLSSFGNVASYIRQRFQLRGPDYSFNTACTASANALLSAGNMLNLGNIDHALVVGVELYNDITALGFHGLDLLTRSVMKPFDRDRDGLVLGEACSAVVLGRNKPNSVKNPFYLCGGANRCDTYSISAANPDGSTIAEVMRLALHDADIDHTKINAVKAHGTASLSNDESEARGLLSVFDCAMPPICALKPFVGHTLGACGLSELILFYRAIDAGFLPATPGIGVDDSGLGVKLNQAYDLPDPGCYLLNYFGFGGNNSSVIISNK